jgi:coenzyme F420-reducing hydrogenase delta subunit
MCSGRVDPAFILRAFLNGTDGVFIGGCWLGECHYITEGNYNALSIMHLCRKLLDHIGVNPERLRLEWVSASEGIRFAEIMTDFTKKLKELGPLGKGEGIDEHELKFKLEAVTKLIPYIKLVQSERLRVSDRTEEAYNKFFTSEEFNRLFKELIGDKLAVRKQDVSKVAVDNDKIDQILNKHQGKARSLVQVLLEIQHENHWLPQDVLDRVSEKLDVPLSRVRQIVTFHKTFSLTPNGRNEVLKNND